MTALVAALGALALLTMLPGPDVAVVTRMALAGGRRAAFGAAVGISAGCLAWGLLTAAGLAAVLAASATAFAVVKFAGAAYLIWLGLTAWWHTRQAAGSGGENADVGLARRDGATASFRPALRTGLVTNLLNPKIGVFYTSLLPQLVPPGWPTVPTIIALVLAHGAMSLLWLNGYALVLHRAGGVLRRPVVQRRIERLTGTVLIALGVRLAVQRS